jgi:hypothetical protein
MSGPCIPIYPTLHPRNCYRRIRQLLGSTTNGRPYASAQFRDLSRFRGPGGAPRMWMRHGWDLIRRPRGA